MKIYNKKACKLSSTHALVQNKLKEPTNTTMAFVDLDLQNYDGKQA
jgi:hypothetical protein